MASAQQGPGLGGFRGLGIRVKGLGFKDLKLSYYDEESGNPVIYYIPISWQLFLSFLTTMSEFGGQGFLVKLRMGVIDLDRLTPSMRSPE